MELIIIGGALFAVGYALFQLSELKRRIEMVERSLRRLASREHHIGKKGSLRAPVRLTTHIEVNGQRLDIVVNDISKSGAQIQCGAPLAESQRLTLYLDHNGAAIGAAAVIARKVSDNRYGIRFEETSLRFRRAVTAIMAKSHRIER